MSAGASAAMLVQGLAPARPGGSCRPATSSLRGSGACAARAALALILAAPAGIAAHHPLTRPPSEAADT